MRSVPAHDRTNLRDGAAAEHPQVIDRVDGVREHPRPNDRFGLTGCSCFFLILLVVYHDKARTRIVREIVEGRDGGAVEPTIERDKRGMSALLGSRRDG